MRKTLFNFLLFCFLVSCQNKNKENVLENSSEIESITFNKNKPSILIEKDTNFIEFGFDTIIRRRSKEFLKKDTLIILNPSESLNISKKAFKLMLSHNLEKTYEFSNRLNPNQYIEDFNGDNVPDLVVVVNNIQNNKLGVIVFHSDETFHIIGAGSVFAYNWDDISGYNKWHIEKNKKTYEMVIDSITGDILGDEPVTIENIGISFREFEGSGGLIYWNGTEYKYLHQGD